MFEVMFAIVPILVLGFFIFIGYSIISQKIKDDRSPIIRTEATVVTKRISVSTDSNFDHGTGSGRQHYYSSTDTNYYVTFELASGERKEFYVYGNEYGLLVEKDRGYLTYQGSRFKGFEIIS